MRRKAWIELLVAAGSAVYLVMTIGEVFHPYIWHNLVKANPAWDYPSVGVLMASVVLTAVGAFYWARRLRVLALIVFGVFLAVAMSLLAMTSAPVLKDALTWVFFASAGGNLVNPILMFFWKLPAKPAEA
jgi:Na+/H+-dicarboxylate symporter